MALIMQPPVYNHVTNPAESFVTTGNVEFALTIPEYNGTSILDLTEHQALSPTIAQSPVAVQIGAQVFKSTATVTAVPVHTISWPMMLPVLPGADGMWRAATEISGRELINRLELVYYSRKEVGRPLREEFDVKKNRRLISQKNKYRVFIQPKPTAQEFIDHITRHETQHVADHMWLAERIIGWWDAWLTELAVNNITVVKRDGGGIPLAVGYNYAVGVPRILMGWAKAAAASGDLYHKTMPGAHAVFDISRLTDHEIVITATPRSMLHVLPDLVNPRPHQPLEFTVAGIDGNEKLKAGAAPNNPFLNRWNRVDATHWERA